MLSYHHVRYPKKNNDAVLRKFSDGRTDRPVCQTSIKRRASKETCQTTKSISSLSL